jgi:hypothetical protein
MTNTISNWSIRIFCSSFVSFIAGTRCEFCTKIITLYLDSDKKVYSITWGFVFNCFDTFLYCFSHDDYLFNLIKDKYKRKWVSVRIRGERIEWNECTSINMTCTYTPFWLSRERNRQIFAKNGRRFNNNTNGDSGYAAYVCIAMMRTVLCSGHVCVLILGWIIHHSIGQQSASQLSSSIIMR